jgi:hypothetical protein
MKIFNLVEPWTSKVNFVDENNVALGYDMHKDCCEYAGWFVVDIITTQIPEDDETKAGLHTAKIWDLDGWIFDKDFFKEFQVLDDEKNKSFDGGTIAVFRIVNGDAQKFIHLFNCHNGYYSHGFTFAAGEKIIKEKEL